jgi:hypothetical protein
MADRMQSMEASKEVVRSMDMLVMGLCFTLIGLAVAMLAFVAATRPETLRPAEQPEQLAAKPAAARFFSERIAIPATPAPPIHIPIEALLLEIENHVRLEQAAAESFVAFPSHAQLHSKTTSRFVN